MLNKMKDHQTFVIGKYIYRSGSENEPLKDWYIQCASVLGNKVVTPVNVVDLDIISPEFYNEAKSKGYLPISREVFDEELKLYEESGYINYLERYPLTWTNNKHILEFLNSTK